MGAWILFPPTRRTVGLKGGFFHFTDPLSPTPTLQDRAISQEKQVGLSLVTSAISHLQTFIEHLLCA